MMLLLCLIVGIGLAVAIVFGCVAFKCAIEDDPTFFFLAAAIWLWVAATVTLMALLSNGVVLELVTKPMQPTVEETTR